MSTLDFSKQLFLYVARGKLIRFDMVAEPQVRTNQSKVLESKRQSSPTILGEKLGRLSRRSVKNILISSSTRPGMLRRLGVGEVDSPLLHDGNDCSFNTTILSVSVGTSEHVVKPRHLIRD